jgi:hypothetical protein
MLSCLRTAPKATVNVDLSVLSMGQANSGTSRDLLSSYCDPDGVARIEE